MSDNNTIKQFEEVFKKELSKQLGEMEERIDGKIDDLAIIVKDQFDGVQKQFDGAQKQFDDVREDLKYLKNGQENLELKLTNVAYRFELKDLEQRVKVLENKMENKK